VLLSIKLFSDILEVCLHEVGLKQTSGAFARTLQWKAWDRTAVARLKRQNTGNSGS